MLEIFTENIETYISNYLYFVTGTTLGCYYESKWSLNVNSTVDIEIKWFWNDGDRLDSYDFSFPISFFLEDEKVFKAKVDSDLAVSCNNRLKLESLEELIEKN